MKSKKEMALFMCFLVLSIPFISANAMASRGYISDVQVSGEDGIAGTVAKSDSLNINATVSAFHDNGDRMEILPSNVKLTFGTLTTGFTSCEDTGAGYYCTYKGQKRDFAGGSYTVNVKLYDPSNIRLAQADASFSVDSSPPRILSFTVTRSGSNAVNIYYDVQDIACASCGSACIGLDKAEIQIGGQSKKALEVSGCSSQSSLTASYSELGIKDGSQEICLVVQDKYQQKTTSCVSFEIDTAFPKINSLMITDLQGKEVHYSSLFPIPIRAVLNLSEEKGLAEVYGDFSALNTMKPGYERMIASCNGGPDYSCSWSGLEIHNPKENAVVRVTAKDSSGNERNYSKTLQLPLDSEAPVVQSIKAPFGDFLRAKGNTIIAEVLESGSGMSRADAYLSLYSLNPNSASRKADNCTGQGTWICSWSGIDADGKNNGDSITISIDRLRDDAGNTYSQVSGQNSKVFIYDDKAPVFKNITIAPLGTGLDVLTMSDIADIRAYISENESGIEPASVLADFSVFGRNWTSADSCDFDNRTGLFVCIWQYSGQYKRGPVKLRIQAADRAGNRKDSSEDRVFGVTSVVDTRQQVVDWWGDKAKVGSVPALNRNFIWMSSVGALERVEFELISRGGASRYVHAMDVSNCRGSFGRKNESDRFDSFSVKAQYYYPGQSKHKKYILLNIPQYDRKGIADVTSIKVNCSIEIVQSATKSSDILTPNEKAYAEFEIPLMSGIFEAPDSAVIGKLNEKNATIQTLNSLITNIRWVTSFMTPLCKLVSTLRQIISGVALLMVGTSSLTGINFLQAPGLALTAVSDYFTTVIWRGGAGAGISFFGAPVQVSTKNHISLGYWCDLVLCEDCSNFWKGSIMYMVSDENARTKAKDSPKPFGSDELDEKLFTQAYLKWADPQKTIGDLWGGGSNTQSSNNTGSGSPAQSPEQRVRAFASTKPSIFFDPKKSLLTAVICYPPCLTGIEGKLQAYKQILITYNACVNVAAVRGQDMGQCEEFLSAEICQQIVWEFWSIIDSFLKKVFVNYVMYITVQNLRNKVNSMCTAGSPQWSTNCLGQRVFEIIDLFTTLAGTMQAINELMNHEWFRQSDAQNQQQAEDHINSELDRKDKKGYGTMPKY